MKKIGVVGLGTVGGGFYDLAIDRKEFQISKVLNRSQNKYHLHNVPTSKIASNVEELIDNVDIVIETVGGTDFAYELIMESLEKGKDVVTANKALIASKGVEILGLAKKRGRKVLFSASVGGGMPALRNVRYHSFGKIKRVYGILNATSNFVLFKMSRGMSMEKAIEIAQQEGYAEQDPTDDIMGMDAARKISIICGMITGKLPQIEKIPIKPINLGADELAYAKRLESVIKPMVYLSLEEKKMKIFVGPLAIPSYSRIAEIDGTENCLVIEGESGTNFISGVGAGKNPTAFAVLADVLSIINEETYRFEFNGYVSAKLDAPAFEEFKSLKIFRPSI